MMNLIVQFRPQDLEHTQLMAIKVYSPIHRLIGRLSNCGLNFIVTSTKGLKQASGCPAALACGHWMGSAHPAPKRLFLHESVIIPGARDFCRVSFRVV